MSNPAQYMRLLLIVLAKNEETQLEKTVRDLQTACSPEQVAGMVLLLAQNVTEGCLRTANTLCGEWLSRSLGFPIPIEVVQQSANSIPDGIITVLDSRPDASHVLLLVSDGFLESVAVSELIARAAQDRDHIYKISRALPGGAFSPQYCAAETWLYRLFCAFVRLLFGCSITDPAFGVMVVPVHLFQLVRLRHKTLLFWVEWMYALLRSETVIVEIPAIHLPRTEKEGSSTILSRLRYVTIAIQMRFAPKKSIWTGDILRSNEKTN